MTRRALLLCALAVGCASGASGPPVTEPGAPPPTSAPARPEPVVNPNPPEVPPEGSGDLASDAQAVGIRRLGRWDRPGFESRERLVIRDAATLSGFWRRLGAGEPPAVDFDRELVVAAAAGQKTGGGHTISVGRAALRDGVLLLEILETAPSPDCMTTQALTHPVDVVAMPAGGVRNWRFVERREVGGCS